MMSKVEVSNLATGDTLTFGGLTSAGAVIAAYAQSRGDMNTWDYWAKYSKLLTTGQSGKTVACGDFSALVGSEEETKEMPAVVECVDCKRVIPEKQAGAFTPNYGIDSETGNMVCLDCCAYRDKGEMIMLGKAWLYLTIDAGQWERRRFNRDEKMGKITNWPGTLEFRGSVKRGRHNIARVRYDVWFAGPDGFVWHGVQVGDNTQIVRCKRTKERAIFGRTQGKMIAKVFPDNDKERVAA